MEASMERIRETEANRELLAESTLSERVWPTDVPEFVDFQRIIDVDGQ
jgi:hypothetical protein